MIGIQPNAHALIACAFLLRHGRSPNVNPKQSNFACKFFLAELATTDQDYSHTDIVCAIDLPQASGSLELLPSPIVTQPNHRETKLEVSAPLLEFCIPRDHSWMPDHSADPPETNPDVELDIALTPPTEESDSNEDEGYFDDFVEDLNDPECVQKIYDFSLRQIRGMVEYNDEDDLIQDVFYRLHKWPIGKKYNSAKHYFSLLKITVRQAIAAYWRRRHSQRNDARKRVFISQLQKDGNRAVEFTSDPTSSWQRLHLKDLARRVLEKAETLSDQQRKMFKLRFLEEKSHEEIAKALGVSIRTSYRIETRIREILQTHFKSLDK